MGAEMCRARALDVYMDGRGGQQKFIVHVVCNLCGLNADVHAVMRTKRIKPDEAGRAAVGEHHRLFGYGRGVCAEGLEVEEKFREEPPQGWQTETD